jgi:ribosomal protein S18 acetylase RimI-like enzyme
MTNARTALDGPTTPADLTEAAHAAAMTAFRDVAGVSIEDEGDLLRTVARGRPFSFLNAVLRLDLDPEHVPERVAQIEAAYRSLGLYPEWWVTMGSRPMGLRVHFAGLGLSVGEDDQGMAIDLDPWPEAVSRATSAHPADLAVLEVATAADLADWIDVKCQSYGFRDPARAATYAVLYDTRAAPRAGRTQLLARLGTRAVAIASLFEVDGLAWVTNIGTVPTARGRGIGKAVTAASLAIAAERGHRRAWLAASSMGASLYRRLGFVDTGPLVSLVRDPSERATAGSAEVTSQLGSSTASSERR